VCEYNDEYLSLGIDDGEDKNLHFFLCCCFYVVCSFMRENSVQIIS